jgi:hypothetical protein
MENKNVEVPIELWADFINVIYAAVQHITPTRENAEIITHLKGIVLKAFKDEDVLVVDGKIVDKKEISNGK